MNSQSKKRWTPISLPAAVTALRGYIPVHPCSSRFLFGGLTMKQGKNIVKRVRSKDLLFRPVPSAYIK